MAGVFESGLYSAKLGFAPLFKEEHWYQQNKERLESDREFFGTTFRLNQLIERDEPMRDIRKVSGRWLSRALQPQDRFLVEKTPQHLETMGTISEIFPGAVFIHVVRDGRDMAVSQQAAARSWPGQHGRTVNVGATATYWATELTSARDAAEREGLRYTEVRYEQMRLDPGGELIRLFDFCDIPTDKDLIARICEATSLSNQRRGEGDAFRRRGQVGEWRDSFGLRDRFRFDRGAGDMLVELGYEANRAWWLRPQRGAKGSDRGPGQEGLGRDPGPASGQSQRQAAPGSPQ